MKVVESPAKINLTLSVGHKSGNYHLVETVLHEIGLKDRMVFQKGKWEGVEVVCNHPDVPSGKENIVYKAVEALMKAAGKKGATKFSGIRITIQKKIPVAAGLGGGSGNAAIALITLNEWLKLGLSQKKLLQIAAGIGMDVPFFIKGGTARGTHFGEEIQSLPRAKMPPGLIVMNSKKRGTTELYKKLDAQKKHIRKNCTKELVSAIRKGGKITPELLANDFDAVYESGKGASTRAVQKLKKKLLHSGASGVHICGSGAALYAVYKTKAQRDNAYRNLRKEKLMFLWKI